VVKVRLPKGNTPSALNIAHRGGAQLWPENTLFAFVLAAKAGYDGAELDVQMTRDEQLVVFHDFRLKRELCRTCDGRWVRRRGIAALPLIRELTFAELQEFDVGRPKPGTLYAKRHKGLRAHDGEHMPSLAQVIAGVRAVKPDFQLFVEIKTSLKDPTLSAAPEVVAEAAIAELRNAKFLANTVLVGFDWRGLIHAKRLEPELRCWFSTEPRTRISAASIKQAGGDGWFCSLDRTRARNVNEARALGLFYGVWTVNAARDMRAALDLGVDAICTDRPDRLRTLLEDYSPSNKAVER
jgi:glycerophosphoryl diester phosphodiesterase